MSNLQLRNKLALVYTVLFVVILGVAFLSIYVFSERYREEEFYKRLSDRTNSTFKIIVQVDQIDNNLLRIFDKNTINSLSEEKIMLFDSCGALIYSSTDKGSIDYAEPILQQLKTDENVIQESMDKYEILGIQFTDHNKTYYGVARAFDQFGRSKVHFLAVLLISTFCIATLLVVILSFYLARIVTKPITLLTQEVEKISPERLSNRVRSATSDDEIGFLTGKFNEMLDKVENAFKFQSYYIQHLSHELKTPLAVMMASAERALADQDREKLSDALRFQKDAIMDLSHIINAMLDISRTEHKLAEVMAERIRIDEVVFECMEEIALLNPNASFDFRIDEHMAEPELTVRGNSRMIKMAVMNLVRNAVNFSGKLKPAIDIKNAGQEIQIIISNDGALIDDEDREMLFKHLFRGKNSHSVKGFGLGLVLAQRIIRLHKGLIVYRVSEGMNNFVLTLPNV